MNNIMIDLETTGMGAGCCILSIGAVEFSSTEGKTGRELYQVIGLETQKALGLHDDPSTIEWWEKQSPEARKVLDAARSEEALPLAASLAAFGEFIKQCGDPLNMRMWGNGADFDNAILAEAYRVSPVPLPWKFWNNRCYRTLKNFFPWIKMERQGTHHNALDDAKSQATHAIQMLRVLYAATRDPEEERV